MRLSFTKFIIAFIALLFVFEPVLQLNQIRSVKAQTTPPSVPSTENRADEPYSGDSNISQPTNIDSAVYKISMQTRIKTAPTDDIILRLADLHSEEDQLAGIGLDEVLSNQVEPRLILNSEDQRAIKILWRMSGTWMMPDFEREPEAIWEQYPKFKSDFQKNNPDAWKSISDTLGHEITSVDDIAILRASDVGRARYLDLTHEAQKEWSKNLGEVASYIKTQADTAIKNGTGLESSFFATISEITDQTVDYVARIFEDNGIAFTNKDESAKTEAENRYKNLMDSYTENIQAIKIDIRVINMLVYLVTPKTQGGAGHYRIKVKRILAGYTTPRINSRESDTMYSLNSQAKVNKKTDTAASIGQNRSSTETGPISLGDDDSNADAIVYDNNGDSFNAFVTDALAADSETTGTSSEEDLESDVNISAHSDGQAVDISEVDDIRCTLIKKRRIGDYTRSKFLQRPIKLEWQTASGFATSGGNLYENDMANVLKSYAADSIRDLVNEFGGNIDDFDGDLSSSSFSDIAMLIGKSLFSEIINSPDANLSGYNFGDTLSQLGGMYLADYLGLPRNMFTETSMPSTYDELVERIGTAAIEKRLDLPTGTFAGDNLSDMLKKAGQRKLEYEMNLKTGALDRYFQDYEQVLGDSLLTRPERTYLIGKAIIEQELNLPQGSFTGIANTDPKNFAELKKSLGEIKSNMVFRDPVFADNMLHISLGTTQELIDGLITPYFYAVEVGSKREEDTIYGFKYMTASDAAYELDEDTFNSAINGDLEALRNIGIKNMARIFTFGDDERVAFVQWVRANLEKDDCSYDDPVKVFIPSGDTTKEVTISEEKALDAGLHRGDMYSMFACKEANPRASFQTVGSKILRTALVQYYLNPNQKFKFDLLNSKTTFYSSDPEKQFYVERIYRAIELVEQIQRNWNDVGKDPEYARAKAVVDESITNIKAILDSSQPILTIDQAKAASRNIAVAVNNLKVNCNALRFGSNRLINKVNAMIIDVNELTRTITEIIEGKEVPSTDDMTFKDIPGNAFTDSPDTTSSAPVLNDAKPRSRSDSLVGLLANKQTIMALLARKMKPADFFMIMAADKVEVSLNLPQNSLVYFVQNFEKRGLGTIDSFYSAIGQAKLEETFSMPSKYFQGMFISDASLDAPDFKNDLYALYEYAKYDVEGKIPPITFPDSVFLGATKKLEDVKPLEAGSFKNPIQESIMNSTEVEFDFLPASGAPTSLTDEQKEVMAKEHYVAELILMKKNRPDDFNYIVNKARTNYERQIKEFINGLNLNEKDLEVSIQDVIDNIEVRKLNDKIRTPEKDLLFRMGIPGSFDALKSNSSVAWFDAVGRTNQIDKLLNLPAGTTKALFTGERIETGSGGDRISTKDKQKLVAEMGISPVALDLLSRVLSGEISHTKLDEKAIDVTNMGDNPYFGNSGDSCQSLTDGATAGFFQDDGSDGSTTAGKLVANDLNSDSWFYFDKTIDTRGGRAFGSRVQAESYRADHEADQATYKYELAYGLAKLMYAPSDFPDKISETEEAIDRFLKGGDSPIRNDMKASIETNLGVSSGALDKLFTRSESVAWDKPLVSYKRAVGRQVVKQTLNSKLFNALGVRIDSSLFTGNEFFDIMRGDYSSILSIAGYIIDQKLSIPYGSIMKLFSAKNSNLRDCSMAEIGGSIVGQYIGLDYVSLKGNIYQNVGRSRLEKFLGLPKNSFSGANIEELIKNVGPVNFYLAFEYPVLNDLPGQIQNALVAFYGNSFAEKHKNYSHQFKLRKIKDFLDVNSSLISNKERHEAWKTLQNNLISNVTTTSDQALRDGSWRNGDKGIWEHTGGSKISQDEIVSYLARLDIIDSTFGIPRYLKPSRDSYTGLFISGEGTTIEKTVQVPCGVDNNGNELTDSDGRKKWDYCQMDLLKPKLVMPGYPRKDFPGPFGLLGCNCNQETNPVVEVTVETITRPISPSDYVDKIAGKSFLALATRWAVDMLDLDTDSTAIIAVLTHYGNWVKEGLAGIEKLYTNLSKIFSINMDARVGLDDGTVAQLIRNPGNFRSIMIPQATRRVDKMLDLKPSDRWSVSGIYARYFSGSVPTSTDSPINADDACYNQLDIATLRRNILEREQNVYTWLERNGIYNTSLAQLGQNESGEEYAVWVGSNNISGESVTDNLDYTAMTGDVAGIAEMKVRYNQMLADCKNGLRYGDDSSTENLGSGNEAVDSYESKNCPTSGATTSTDPICSAIDSSVIGSYRYTGKLNWQYAWTIITDYASEKLSQKIYERSKGTISMPLSDIKHFFSNGDMRYFTSALFSYTVNTYLNKLLTGSDKTDAVPEAYRVSYEMIKLWVVGNAEAEDYAADLATASFFSDESVEPSEDRYESSLVPSAYGDVAGYDYGSGGFFGIYSSQEFEILSASAGRMAKPVSERNLIDFNKRQSDYTLNNGRGLSDDERLALAEKRAGFEDELRECNDNIRDSKYTLSCGELLNSYNQLEQQRTNARSGVRQRFGQQIKYRTMDAVLWTKDRNIFPGFSQMLFEGSGKQKNVAIGLYLRNGLTNGEFFGHKIEFLQRLEEKTGLNALQWTSILNWSVSFASGTKTKEETFNLAIGTGAFDALATLISNKSSKWFKFEMDEKYVKSILLGAFTGKWTGDNHKVDSVSIPTMGSLIKENFYNNTLGKAFNWADRQAKWKPGTAKLIFDDGLKIYQSIQTYKQLQRIKTADKLVSKAGADFAVNNTFENQQALAAAQAHRDHLLETSPQAKEAIEKANPVLAEGDVIEGEPISLAEQITLQVIGTMITDYLTKAAMRWIGDAFGEAISEFEEDYSLVPGSASILIEGAVSYGIGTGLHAAFPNSGLFEAVGPAGLYMALAMFVLTNLFDYYDVDLKCTADGYYPELEWASIANDSESGLGEWDGMDENIAKEKTIASAQYKARRLIQDVLEMHKNPLYADVYPNQIMTGRNEDVLALNDSISANICSKIGLVSIAGICGGDTRAGVWQNDQMSEYTHIGF